ncbi:thiamine phosphate synthase [Anaerovorax odorimutans]|uniref:thiamine phosphate synthase n=1 Tax=Anaerovorax odorimutans TaxID=109327 RepID=UPI00041461A8|nr:thiamine phosphate synthase [Anaerovorax odorimutans]
MKLDKSSMLLYAVTDRKWLLDNSLKEQVEQAIKAGVTFVQLREKDLNDKEFIQEAENIKKITDKYNIPFVINDNLEVALSCGADGVHVGQSDMKASDARNKLGKDKILGVSVQTVQQALEAEKNGADYLGVGAVFSTTTKADANNVSFATLKEICDAVSIPVVAIGGINKDNIMQLKGSNVDGVAVVSAIFAERDIYNSTKELYKLTCEMVKK